MPPKAAKSTTKKRSIEEVGPDVETSQAKSRSTVKPLPKSNTTPVDFRIARGPEGEPFIPNFLPEDCLEALEKGFPAPRSWLWDVDDTPGRDLTLGNRQWWETHGPWLEAHKSILKLKPGHWKRRQTAKDPDIKEHEGKDDWDFVCVHPPKNETRHLNLSWKWDENEDDSEEEDHEEEDHEEKDDDEEENDDELIGKFASLHPDHLWTSSLLGHERYRWWNQESLKRGRYDVYPHMNNNDFTSNGQLELLDNIFLQIDKVFKREPTYRQIWPEVEAFAYVLDSNWFDFWMCKDKERATRSFVLVGHVVICVFDYLKAHYALKEIPSLGLVLSMFICWGWPYSQSGSMKNEACWVYRVKELADKEKITLTGSDRLKSVLFTMSDRFSQSRKPRASAMKAYTTITWQTWRKQVEALKQHGGSLETGKVGKNYDLTQMTAEQRKELSYMFR